MAATTDTLQSLLQSIKSSEVVELVLVIEYLNMFWEDFTCLDVSQCMLNKAILNVAMKNIESNISGCLGHFFSLGSKASSWCGKHLKMTLMESEDSQEEEHSNAFFQLLLDVLNYSAAGFSALSRYPVSDDNESMASVEKFTYEQLNLTKDSILELKKIQGFGLDPLKVAQSTLDSVIRLCKVYSHTVNWDDVNAHTETYKLKIEEDKIANHVINITKCTIDKLCELGILAANNGGNLVTLLNCSWKGVVSLLQQGKGALALKVNVTDIILNLLTLANESLKSASETWSCSLEAVSATEAKRIFLPVKFYVINAVRILSQYPHQAFLIYKEVTLCALMISTFRISMSKDDNLKCASEVLAEILEPTSFHLLNSLLSSSQLRREDKCQILVWLFNDDNDLDCILETGNNVQRIGKLDDIFLVKSDSVQRTKILLLGHVSLFINLLKSAPDLEEDTQLDITTKLRWLLNSFADEEVYSNTLSMQTIFMYRSDKIPEYQPMLFVILHALKTFMIAVSSSVIWEEVVSFLLENFFHPHFLCHEIVMELWCFIIRNSEVDLVNDIMHKLCLLLRSVTSYKTALIPNSSVRKIARSVCVLLSCGSKLTADYVYNNITGGDNSNSFSIMFTAMLMEGFPLKLLSDKMQNIVKQRVVTEYYQFLEMFDGISLRHASSGVFGAQVYAMSAVLQSLQVSLHENDLSIFKFLHTIISLYRSSSDDAMKEQYRNLLSETLVIISKITNLYSSNGIEDLIMELKNLFITMPAESDTRLYECKPSLAAFMAGTGHVDLSENVNCVKMSALSELYHMLLRERHWAFTHLAIVGFGYFAARTLCNQLWRFVPEDAALSFDLESGKDVNEERFMSELKALLEKERAIAEISASSGQLCMVAKEGMLLKSITKKNYNLVITDLRYEKMEIDDSEEQCKKRRKLPDGIRNGVELLKNGLKVIGDGISELDQNVELHDKFLAHVSRLDDAIGQLAGLASNSNG
ncbi:uncharacterized protein LOC124927228 isoform X2 [Impatiens glandulifera]|uniref:uncharacterized protein LOC124927228 isoform X2 n=1 Tax=Impatiens glandulifera TaxID=253017 RepID=UPI001FB115E0|nr:uncharacterized protein LOC124927228 isoform X2 [Impatiens glandulifera]